MAKKNEDFVNLLGAYTSLDQIVCRANSPLVRSFKSDTNSTGRVFLIETLDKRYYYGCSLDSFLEMKEKSYVKLKEFYIDRSKESEKI